MDNVIQYRQLLQSLSDDDRQLLIEQMDEFVKKSSIIYYSREALEEIHKDIEQFAACEQLTAHANSIAVRFEKEED